MTGDWLQTLQTILQNLLSSKSNQFLGFASTLIFGFGTIRLVMVGINWMFTGYVDFLQLIREFVIIGAAVAMQRGYMSPMYVHDANGSASLLWDESGFVGLIQKGPQQLAQAIGKDAFEQLDQTFIKYNENNPPPVATVILNGLSYWIIRICIELTRFAMFFVMSWGFVVQAICILIGPIFIPFLLFQPMEWMFWGWFRCFVQYSFYPVIGAAMVHVFSMLLINIWTSPLGPSNGGPPGMAIVPFFLLSIVGILGAPSLVSHIFSGSSGGGAGSGMVGAAVTKLVTKGAA